ncbi:MAG TPA: hypothetical protein VKU41_32490 [Polyangiaceae bacterium]|nr:hypothetical protein [Polyangiaceae bacterium]
MLPLVVWAAPGAVAAVATGDRPAASDKETRPRARSGIAVGFALGGGLAGGSGYPNNATQIGDPAHYVSSGWMGGTTETILAMGAIADYLNFGFFFSHASFENGYFRSNGNGGGLRVEAYPFVRLYPRLSGAGFFGQFGIGGGNLVSKQPNGGGAEGTQSFVGAGALYEWSVVKIFGGHVAVGPSLEYDAIFSQPFERHGLLATARVVFYGGP